MQCLIVFLYVGYYYFDFKCGIVQKPKYKVLSLVIKIIFFLNVSKIFIIMKKQHIIVSIIEKRIS